MTGPLVRARPVRSLRQFWHRGPLILLYHRVADLPRDPWALGVSPSNFEEQMEVLRRRLRPIPLGDMVTGIVDRTVPRDAVAVTFDDGYADNLSEALPVLERAGIPATVFVATGAIGDQRGFWWDRLEAALLGAGETPDDLELEVDGVRRRWRLGERAGPGRLTVDPWRAGAPAPTKRQQAFVEIWRWLRTARPEERERALDVLEEWSGPGAEANGSARAMTATELRRLVRGGLVEVGAHSVSHPRLSELDRTEQEREIRGSRDELDAVLGRHVLHFAYPHGNRGDFTGDTVALVREAGYTCACTAVPGTVRRARDPFTLRRVSARDYDGERFARYLSRFAALRPRQGRSGTTRGPGPR